MTSMIMVMVTMIYDDEGSSGVGEGLIALEEEEEKEGGLLRASSYSGNRLSDPTNITGSSASCSSSSSYTNNINHTHGNNAYNEYNSISDDD
jgi:hypothetical protein